MRATVHIVLLAATIAVLPACARRSESPSVTPSQAAASIAVTAKPTTADAMVDFTMPDFKGMILQKAQDRVQEVGIFFSKSHDLRGNRNQVIDSNWQVCTQTPEAGAQIKGKSADYEGKIDFGVVKTTEKCP